MTENLIKNDVKNYLESNYGSLNFKGVDFKNNAFDLFIWQKNLNLKIEYKCRFFDEKNKNYLFKNDILIELFQSVFEISKLLNIDNGNINNKTSSERINISIGWFYKCEADRLLFLRYLSESLYDIIDIDFKPFRNWFMNNLQDMKLQFSSKTTGTINAIIPIDAIPKNMILYKKFDELQCELLNV